MFDPLTAAVTATVGVSLMTMLEIAYPKQTVRNAVAVIAICWTVSVATAIEQGSIILVGAN